MPASGTPHQPRALRRHVGHDQVREVEIRRGPAASAGDLLDPRRVLGRGLAATALAPCPVQGADGLGHLVGDPLERLDQLRHVRPPHRLTDEVPGHRVEVAANDLAPETERLSHRGATAHERVQDDDVGEVVSAIVGVHYVLTGRQQHVERDAPEDAPSASRPPLVNVVRWPVDVLPVGLDSGHHRQVDVGDSARH